MSSTAEQDVYDLLAAHLTGVVHGWLDHDPGNGALHEILRENLSEKEARALSEIPLGDVPLSFVLLDELTANSSFAPERLEEILDGLATRGLLYARQTEDGQKSYAMLKGGFGYPQTFFWKGTRDAHARKMAELNGGRAFAAAFRDFYTMVPTKGSRYIPTTAAIDSSWQNVYPTETIEKVIEKATKIALAHCPCRMGYELASGRSCGHSTEVCIKLNELAEALIAAGLAREITREEAVQVIKKADAEGLVHFADNTGEGIKHICNCCGDACWNVRPIRRRQVPRDLLMATYFLRQTDEDACTACEECVKICPVAAVQIENDVAKVDLDWCIGCGVCVPRCDQQAIRLVQKENRPAGAPDFVTLHTQISVERANVYKETARMP